MANKKITNKDRDQQLGYLTQTVSRCFNLLGAYIDVKGDDVEFKKFWIEKEAEAKKEMEKRKNEVQRNEAADRKNLATDTGDKGRRPEGVRSNR